MLRFNIQQAKKDGHSEEEIQRMIQSGPPQNMVRTPVKEEKPQSSGVGNLLPIIASILGGALGAPLGPAGVIGGSAIGSGFGEFGRQSLAGEDSNLQKILGETVIGGVGGGIGSFFGAGRAARAASKVGTLEKVGKGVASNPYKTTAMKLVKGKNPLKKATDIAKTASGLEGRTAISKSASLEKERKALTKVLEGIAISPEAKMSPVDGKELFKLVKVNASESALDLASGGGKSAIKSWGPKIRSVRNYSDLAKLDEKILVKMQSVSKGQKEILSTIRKPLADLLKSNKELGVGPIYKNLSKLNAAEETLKKQATKGYTIPFTGVQTTYPTRGIQYAQDVVGEGLTKVGRSGALPLAGGQAVTRFFTGGQEPSADYVPEEDFASLPEGYEDEAPGLNLTAENVALARLILPDKQADALEAAYKIMNPEGKDRTEAQVARDEMSYLIDSAFQQLAGGSVKTGPISPRVEELKSVFNAGDPETIDFNRTISALTAAIAKARAGTSFTPNEQKLLDKYAPKVGDSQQQLLSKLQGLKSIRLNV